MTSVGTELGSESQNWTLNWAAVGPVEQARRVAGIPSWQEGANDDYGRPTAVRGNRCASRFCDGVSGVGPGGEAHGEIRGFDTTGPGLEELQAWLSAEQCQDVVLESTGPYWEPVGNVNGEGRQIGLANPQEVKHRHGHQTGQNDA